MDYGGWAMDWTMDWTMDSLNYGLTAKAPGSLGLLWCMLCIILAMCVPMEMEYTDNTIQ